MIEVERFLAGHPPFSGLSAPSIRRVANALQVEFFPSGTEVVTEDGEPARFVYMIRRGRVELRSGGVAVDVLQEGELFGFPSLLSGSSPRFTVAVVEDALCYLFDRAVASDVFAAPSGLGFLTRSLRDRDASAASVSREGKVGGAAPAAAPVWVTPEATIAETARAMTRAGASSALVEGDDGLGIVTDRDIRVRAVAAGRTLDEPVSGICSRPARTIPVDAAVEEALFQMLDLGIHHLPVVEDGRVVAVVTDLDLLGMERRGAFRLRSRIQRAVDVAAVGAAGRDIPVALAASVDAGADPAHVGRVVAILEDAMVVRLLELAEDAVGAAPAPFAWLAMGSAGRREQCLGPHQDHALVYADGAEHHDDRFRELAAFVTEGLTAAGLPRCPDGVVATEDAWRGSESVWTRRLATGAGGSRPEDGVPPAVAFDRRPVAGDLDVSPIFDAAVAAVARDEELLGHMARLAVRVDVPIGFLGGEVVLAPDERAPRLDVWARGVHPLTDIARVLALAAGSTAQSTTSRIQAAAEAGMVGSDAAAALEEAFRVLRRARLSHQVWQLRTGRPIDDLVDPDRLDTGERAALRDAFGVIREVQSTVLERALRGAVGT